MQQAAGVIALIGFLFLCFYRWVMLGLSLLRTPIIARVLHTPIAMVQSPKGGNGSLYILIVQVDARVRRLYVTHKALWRAAMPGQLVRLWVLWDTATKFDVLESATAENVSCAARALERWTEQTERR